MRILIWLFIGWLPTVLLAQVTTNPVFPVENKSVTITFDATQGNGGLSGYTGDVYAHTGLITSSSTSGTDWKYVKTEWGENTPETKLTRIGEDLYTLDINPSIREYYNVSGNEEIHQMAFVFRNTDGSLQGKASGDNDIFIDLYEDGLLVRISLPSDNFIIETGVTVTIVAEASMPVNLKLYLNETLISESNDTETIFDYTFTDPGDYWIVVEGRTNNDVRYDSSFLCVREALIDQKPIQYIKGINYPDDQSAVLVLYAPGKDHVFLIGDFNDWRPLNAYQMKRDGDFFWLEVNNLEPRKPYVFQYLVNGTLKLADPYSDLVSDPSHDQYISDNTYPGLIDYPEGKTEGIASVLQPGQDDYSWQVTDFSIPDHETLVIYELLVRDFTEGHSYKGVREKLDYLEGLSINAIELMPINEFEGNISWGYNPSFYFAPDKYYGPKEELKKLIDACHQRGIAVILDLVLNHSYGQSPLVQMYWDEINNHPSVDNPWYNRQHNFLNPAAQWGYDFNHDRVATQQLVDSITSYWMQEYRIDGFRFDFTKGFSNTTYGPDSWGSDYDIKRINNLKRMSQAIWEKKKNAIVIFEHLSDNVEENELAESGILLWGNMNYNYSEGAMGYHEDNKSDLTWGVYAERGWTTPKLITYMESHDEERIAYKCQEFGNVSGDYDIKSLPITLNRLQLSALFLLPLPGPKMIWQFGELGYDVSINFNDRTGEKPILWEYADDPGRIKLYDFYHVLNTIKQTYPVFSANNFQVDLAGPLKSYQLNKNDDHVVVVGNFGSESTKTTITFPATGIWYDLFIRGTLEVNSVTQEIILAPGGYKLFSNFEIEGFEEIITSVKKSILQDPFESIYPNPVSHFLHIPVDNFHQIKIYDLRGKLKMIKSNEAFLPVTLDVSSLAEGIYIVMVSNNEDKVRRFKFAKVD